MSGKGKGFVWFDYLIAFNLGWKQGLVSYEENPIYNLDMQLEVSSHSNQDSQEKIAIKKDLTEKLSREAKDIIKLIINGPEEVLREIKGDRYNIISKDKIYVFLRKQGWKRKAIDGAFAELKNFVSEFD
jgi:hypothetical protein